MAHSTGKHIQAKKNLTKVEFKLFSGSFPKELSKISRRSLNSAVLRTEKLVRKYRMARGHSDEKKAKLLEFRLNNLAKAHARYAKRLDRLDRGSGKVGLKVEAKHKKALTAQRKMRVDLNDSPRNGFLMREKKKIYADQIKEQRNRTAQGTVNSKRVAGFMSARTRKGQVARDRITSAKDER